MKDIPIEEMSIERLRVEYYHLQGCLYLRDIRIAKLEDENAELEAGLEKLRSNKAMSGVAGCCNCKVVHNSTSCNCSFPEFKTGGPCSGYVPVEKAGR